MTTLPHFSYEPDIEKEWLVTNGIGGYAASSLTLANTRRYHGLLVAALEPPLSRTVLLSKLDEQIVIAGKTHTLAINQWRGGAIDKDGLAYLTKIEFNGTIPTFHYNIGQVTLTKTIWLERGLNTVYVRYAYLANHNNQPLELEVRPFANERDYHKLTSGDLNRPFEIKPLAAG